MPKLPEYKTVQGHTHSNYLACTIHPNDPEGNRRKNSETDPPIKDKPWAPGGYMCYGGELIAIAPSRLTKSDRLKILETHPLFNKQCVKSECSTGIVSSVGGELI